MKQTERTEEKVGRCSSFKVHLMHVESFKTTHSCNFDHMWQHFIFSNLLYDCQLLLQGLNTFMEYLPLLIF